MIDDWLSVIPTFSPFSFFLFLYKCIFNELLFVCEHLHLTQTTSHSVSLSWAYSTCTQARTLQPRLDIRTSLVFQLAVVICQPELLGASMRPQPILSPDSSHWEQMDNRFRVRKKVMLSLHPGSSFLQKLETIFKALGLKRHGNLPAPGC